MPPGSGTTYDTCIVEKYHGNFLTSWRVLDIMTNFLASWRVYDVMVTFLASWRVFDVMTNCLTHDVLLTSWRTIRRHDVFFTSWKLFDELFGVMMCFWRHENCLTNMKTVLRTFVILMYFSCHGRTFWTSWRIFYVMTNFLTSWRFFGVMVSS